MKNIRSPYEVAIDDLVGVLQEAGQALTDTIATLRRIRALRLPPKVEQQAVNRASAWVRQARLSTVAYTELGCAARDWESTLTRHARSGSAGE